jgi:hypothetical protein
MVEVSVSENHGIDLVQRVNLRDIKERRSRVVRSDVYAAIDDDPGLRCRQQHAASAYLSAASEGGYPDPLIL